MRAVPEDILGVIREKEHFVLFTHVHPDGDAVGSILGLADILQNMGKRVFVYLDEPVSHLYDFLPNCGRVMSSLDELHQFVGEAGNDLGAIALDCGEADRLGEHRDTFLKIHPFLVIDHHISHRNYGDFRWVQPECSSTGEMVFEISVALGQTLSYQSAFDLYVAIVTDTGFFRYECTGARTLAIAAELVARGVQPEEVAKHIYDNFSPARLRLMQKVLGTLELYEQEQVAFIHVTRDMIEQSGAAAQDVEGFIDYPRSIKTVKVAAFLKETKDCTISVSLRAKGDCDVAEIAKTFGGGGHRNAAGCRFTSEPMESVREDLKRAIRSSISSLHTPLD